MPYTTDTIERFERITGYDYTQLLTDYFNFNEDQKQKIYDYYNGEVPTPDGFAFSELDRLRKEFKNSIYIATLNRESFIKFDSWELFDELEDISEKLNTIYNSSKFLRSAIKNGLLNNSPLVEITLKPQQTLERLARDLNADDPQNDWSDIFLNNGLIEEDYTMEGGALLYVSFQGADPLVINSVVDNIDTAEKTYGLDIASRFDFVNNDLKVLTYKETLLQSAKILTELRKNDNPEFPTQGIDAGLAIGSTLGSVTFPAIFRQIYQNFTTDDSFKSFAITDAEIDGDAVKLTYSVQTRTGEIEQGILKI